MKRITSWKTIAAAKCNEFLKRTRADERNSASDETPKRRRTINAFKKTVSSKQKQLIETPKTDSAKCYYKPFERKRVSSKRNSKSKMTNITGSAMKEDDDSSDVDYDSDFDYDYYSDYNSNSDFDSDSDFDYDSYFDYEEAHKKSRRDEIKEYIKLLDRLMSKRYVPNQIHIYIYYIYV